MWTKSNFTRDGTNHLLCVSNTFEPFNVFLQDFSSSQEAEHHVEESSGKKDRRRACGGDIKASKVDIEKFERETIPFDGFWCFTQPCESRTGSEFCIQNQLAKTKLAYHNLQHSDNLYRESLHECSPKMNRSEDDQILDQIGKVLTWRLFMCQQR